MSTLTDGLEAVPEQFPLWSTGRMYAIAFDLDAEALERDYGNPSRHNAYRDIRDALHRFGFTESTAPLLRR
jgi:hypothetical protein